MSGDFPDEEDEPTAAETVGSLAGLYLGNLLYALELAATTLEGQEKREDAAFYRGIARKLAMARGRERATDSRERGEGRGEVGSRA